MNAKLEKLENNLVKLEITIEAEKFDEGMSKAFFRNAKHFIQFSYLFYVLFCRIMSNKRKLL